jgi:hypothetical protein
MINKIKDKANEKEALAKAEADAAAAKAAEEKAAADAEAAKAKAEEEAAFRASIMKQTELLAEISKSLKK